MRPLTILMATSVVALLPLTAQADPINVSVLKDPSLFGTLRQHDVPGIGPQACGPTSAVNSFVYLQNAYPHLYDQALVPSQGRDWNKDGNTDSYDDMIAAAVMLGSPYYMGTSATSGTFHDAFILGKLSYIEARASGVTEYEAQDHWPWPDPTTPPPSFVAGHYPTWEFLYGELADCEDVEVLLSWDGGGHYVTLIGFTWNDQDDDGMIDVGEGSIQFIDPETGQVAQVDIGQAQFGGAIGVNYPGHNDAWISMAVSEPEPGTLLLLTFGGLPLLRRRRRRA